MQSSVEPGGQVINGESCIVLHVSTGFVHALHIRVLLLHECPPSGAHRFVAIRGATSWHQIDAAASGLEYPRDNACNGAGEPIALCSLPSFNRLARARISSESRWDRRDNRAACLLRKRERAREKKRSSRNLLRNLVAASAHWPAPTAPDPICARRYTTFFVLCSYTSGAHSRSWHRWISLPHAAISRGPPYGVHGATICSLQYAVRLRL